MKKTFSLLLFCLAGIAVASAQNHPPTAEITYMFRTNAAGGQNGVSVQVNDTDGDSLVASLFLIDSVGVMQFMYSTPCQSGAIDFSFVSADAPAPWIGAMVSVTDNQPVSIADMVAQVSIDSLTELMANVEGIRHRTTGLTHLEAVKSGMMTHFAAHGLDVRTQNWTYAGYNALNIFGKQLGHAEPNNMLLHDAHFDSVSNAPGADDNGTGTIGVMEAARVLSGFQFKKTLQFVGFDLEEPGLVGSIRYLTQPDGLLPNENIAAVINHEMIGYYRTEAGTQELPAGFNILFPAAYTAVQQDSFRGNFITNVGNAFSQPLITAFNDAAAAYVPELRVIDVAAPGNSEIAQDLRRSDHAPFWDTGHQALMLTDGSEFRNNNYHTALDVSDSLNFEFLTNVVRATVATLATLAEPISAGLDTSMTIDIHLETNNAPPSSWTCHPNPVSNYLELSRTQAASVTPSDIRLYDIQGRTMLTAQIPAGVMSHTINVSMLPIGKYILQISAFGQPNFVQPFLKE